MSYTIVSWCPGRCNKCDPCHLCYWAGMPTNYDPAFFPCGEPMWGIGLFAANPGGDLCEPVDGLLNIGVTGTWWSTDSGPLQKPPMFPPKPNPFFFIVNGVAEQIWSFDPAAGKVVHFNPGIPTLTGNHGSGGAPVYQSTWGATMQISLAGCIQLATPSNPYVGGLYDPAGSGRFTAVYPYTGPRPDPGATMAWGFNDEGAETFFSSNYSDYGHPGIWAPEPSPNDMYNGVSSHVSSYTILGRELVPPL